MSKENNPTKVEKKSPIIEVKNAEVIKIITYEIRCPYCGHDEEFEELHGQVCSKCKKELLIK